MAMKAYRTLTNPMETIDPNNNLNRKDPAMKTKERSATWHNRFWRDVPAKTTYSFGRLFDHGDDQNDLAKGWYWTFMLRTYCWHGPFKNQDAMHKHITHERAERRSQR